jgi:transposase
VKLVPPANVKPFVKRGKTDAGAEAIAEAVIRPTMPFVAVKTVDQQGLLMLRKVRDLLVRQRTMLTNVPRTHLAEYGMIRKDSVGTMPRYGGQSARLPARREPAPSRAMRDR